MLKKYVFICFLSITGFSFCMEEPKPMSEFDKRILGITDGLSDSIVSRKKPVNNRIETKEEFFAAIKNGNVSAVKWYIYRHPQAVNESDDRGETPLYYACLFREYELINFLLSKKADQENLRNASFLLKPDYREVVDLLSSKEITPGFFKKFLRRKLNALLTDQHILGAYCFIIKYPIVAKRIDKDWGSFIDRDGKNLLFYAVENNKVSLVRRLIEVGLKINIKDKDEKPLLFYAVETGNIELVKLLLSYGAVLNVTHKTFNALWYVTEKLKNPVMVDFLISHEVQSNADVICSSLLEMSTNDLSSVFGNNYNDLLDQSNQFNRDKLLRFVKRGLPKNITLNIFRKFIKENNINAVKSLLLILPVTSNNIRKLQSYFLKKIEYDNSKMFEVLLESISFDQIKHMLNSFFRLCLDKGKWECARKLRLLVDANDHSIEGYVQEYLTDFKIAYDLQKADLTSQLNRGLLSENTRNEMNSALLKLEEKYSNMQLACTPIHLLRDIYQPIEDVPFVRMNLVDAIDLNDVTIFMNYLCEDQSDGRVGHIGFVPEKSDLFYALALNPETEIYKLGIRKIIRTREEYIQNLWAIIDSMLLTNEGLYGQLFSNSEEGDNVIHYATTYSCPEILSFILQMIASRFDTLSNLINAKNNRKIKKNPLDIAIARGSDQIVELLIRYGADIRAINWDLIVHGSDIMPSQTLIRTILENRDIIVSAEGYFEPTQTIGLDATKLCSLIQECKIAQAREPEIRAKAKFKKEIALVATTLCVAAFAFYNLLCSGQVSHKYELPHKLILK